jgi:diguanylate cyclase (GGDEF)-like protein
MSVLDLTAPSRWTAIWDELISGLTVGVLLTDTGGQVLATNDVACRIMRLSKSELLTGARPEGWQVRDDTGASMPDWAEMAAQVLRAGTPMSTPFVITEDDQVTTRIWADYHPVRAHGRSRVLVLLQPVEFDVTTARGLRDPLTGLPSRALLLDRLDQALVRARSRSTLATFVLVDVQGLAAFNEKHGFEHGDQLLTLLAARLRQGLREDDTVARYGGDEYAIVADHPHGAGERIAEQCREVASCPMQLGRKRVRPRLRVSWVTSDGNASVQSVIQRAEEQLATTG